MLIFRSNFKVYKALQRHLHSYKDEKRGPTYLAVQSVYGAHLRSPKKPYDQEYIFWKKKFLSFYIDNQVLTFHMPGLCDMPVVTVHVSDK